MPFPFHFHFPSSSTLFCWLFLLSPFSTITLLFASNGIRQRNSSVPLRQVVEKSRSQSSSLLLLAANVSAPMAAAPGGRHVVIPGIGIGIDHHNQHNNNEDGGCMANCDTKKCHQERRDNKEGTKTTRAFCALERAVDGSLLWHRCFVDQMELNKLLGNGNGSVESIEGIQPNGCRAAQKAAGKRTSGSRGGEGREEEEKEAQQQQQQICWCRPSDSLIAESSREIGRPVSMHARRRKNHPNPGPPAQSFPISAGPISSSATATFISRGKAIKWPFAVAFALVIFIRSMGNAGML